MFFSTGLVACPPNKCVLLVWARLRAPGAAALPVPCTGTNTRRPPRRGVYVSVSVRVPVCRQESQLPQSPMPYDAAASPGSGTRAHSEALQGVRDCSCAGARTPQTSPEPATEIPEPRGRCRASPHPGQPVPAPREPPGARGRLERAAGRRAARGPEGEQLKQRQLVFPALPAPRSRATLPNQNPLPGLPSPPLCAFAEPGTLRSAPEQSEGKQGPEARAITKLPNLPAVSQIPGSCADMVQGRRSRKNKMA